MSSQQLHALKRCVNSKVDASKQAEVIEPAEEAVEAVNKQTQDPAEGCSNCTVLSNKLRKLKKKIVSLEKRQRSGRRQIDDHTTALKVNTVFLILALFFFLWNEG